MKLVAFLAGMAAAFALYALGAWLAFRWLGEPEPDEPGVTYAGGAW